MSHIVYFREILISVSMENIKLANSYTKILFHVGNATGKSAEILENMRRILLVLEASKKLARFLNAPIYSDKTKMDFLKGFLDNIKSDKVTYNLIKTLVENKRIDLLPRIHKYYTKKLLQLEGKEIAKITLAKEMSEKDFKEITSLLEKKLDKKFIATQEVNDEIIAGAVITFGHTMCDLSLRNVHNKLSREINEI